MSEDNNDQRYKAFIAINEAELLKIRAGERDFYHNRSVSAGDRYASSAHDTRARFISFSVEYGKIFINSSLIMNGGAILALLTFLGSLYGKGDIKSIFIAIWMSSQLWFAFAAFSTGLFATLICAGLTYINWMASSGSHSDDGSLMLWQIGLPSLEENDREMDSYDKYIRPTALLSILFGILAAVCFILGCYKVLSAFSSLNIFAHFR
jgi:hypothetical protein